MPSIPFSELPVLLPHAVDWIALLEVKYRDAARNGAGDAASGQASGPEGTKRGSRHRLQSPSASGGRSVEGQGQKGTSRNELDELATVLTPAQLKKFQELNRANRRGRHPGSVGP
jgi:hypothetical protein